MNPAEHHTTSGHSDLLDDKVERLCWRRARDRDQRTAETDEQRGERLRRRQQRDRARRAALCSVERDTALRHKSALWREKLANKIVAQRQARLQQMNNYQQERLALHFADCAFMLMLAPTMIIICLVLYNTWH